MLRLSPISLPLPLLPTFTNLPSQTMCLPAAPTTTTAFIFFFFMPLFASPSPDLETGYSHCSPYPFNCGNVVNVTYPFLAGNRSSVCGYPQMNLACVNASTQLEIESVKYHVSNIRYPDRIFTAVNVDYLGTSCPRPLADTDIGNFTFELGNQSVPLNLLINCSLPETNSSQELHEIRCLNDHYAHPSYYLFGRNGSVLNETFERHGCEKKVEVMVLRTGAEQLRNGSSSYGKVMRDGFDVKWRMGAGWCTDCVESGGICGFDTRVPEQSVCFCHDRYRFASCPAPGGRAARADSRKKIIIGVSAGVGSFVLTWIFFHSLHFYRRKRKLASSSSLLSRDISGPFSKSDLGKCQSTSYATHVFSYKELEEATSSFDSSREIGDGGFGTVYYGKLCDGRSVAVKRLYDNSWRKTELFMNEVKILSSLRHPNLVSLYGCTSRRSRDLLLVYEYVPNGTVADHLHGHLSSTSPLPWPARLSIAAETADALAYLHAADPPVVHRDVKTHNILLDDALHVKVADFGLSRPFPTGGATHVSTSPQGTPGYVDPEYTKYYQLTEKSDVYSFGVVLMELISSMPAVDICRPRNEINLSTLAVNKIHNQALHELVDPKLGYGSDARVTTMIKLVAELAFRCLQEEKDVRPSMEEVLVELRNIEKVGSFTVEQEGISQDQVDHDSKDENAVHELMIKCSATRSPDSVMEKWVSKSTTPNTSS